MTEGAERYGENIYTTSIHSSHIHPTPTHTITHTNLFLDCLLRTLAFFLSLQNAIVFECRYDIMVKIVGACAMSALIFIFWRRWFTTTKIDLSRFFPFSPLLYWFLAFPLSLQSNKESPFFARRYQINVVSHSFFVDSFFFILFVAVVWQAKTRWIFVINLSKKQFFYFHIKLVFFLSPFFNICNHAKTQVENELFVLFSILFSSVWLCMICDSIASSNVFIKIWFETSFEII